MTSFRADTSGVEFESPSLAGQSVTLRGWGPLDASLFAAVLAEATRSGVTTVLLDLTNVDYFSMEAAAALLDHIGHSGGRCQLVLLPSTAVERKLITLGMAAILP
ncbi:hypothetical protein OG738_21645 [Amycolatopsis sp. NBC_01488]|uniref:hypothetical protein n=1 Tax=Amycolatopsis sp. NBC_01488 TaxID=2903563 RepID=UPI002E2C75BC|nr:hypothetical protein [Amycolatopsis sp. NBC_01488]